MNIHNKVHIHGHGCRKLEEAKVLIDTGSRHSTSIPQSSYNSSGNGVYSLEWGSMEQLCSGLSEEDVEVSRSYLDWLSRLYVRYVKM